MDNQWLTCAKGHVPLPIVAGYDSDGDTIYIGRAEYNGDKLPAKIIPDKGKAYVSYAGQEIEVDSYEVLVGSRYQWTPAANGDVPPDAVKVGSAVDDDECLYAGRGHWEGSLIVGKVHPSHGCLYIRYGEEEVSLTEYEVLTHPDSESDVSILTHVIPVVKDIFELIQKFSK